MLLHRGSLPFPTARAAGLPRGLLRSTLPLAALAVTSGGALHGQPATLATRAACHRALAEWTLGRETGPGPFHLHPAVGTLLDGDGSAVRERTEVGVGVHGRGGVLQAGESLPTDDGFRYPGPVERPRRSGGAASLVVREAVGRVALVADATLHRRARVPLARLGVRTGDVVISGGRGGPWPGNGCSSGLVLSGRGEPAGAGIDTGWLRLPLLGPTSLSGFVGTLSEGSSDNPRPFFLAQRAVWPVAEDVRLGVSRAAIFGGRSGSVPVTPRTVGLMLLGITDVEGKDSDFENQVASADLSWRIPTGGSAVRLHLEYGADDFSLAFLRVPALSLGADLVTPTGDDGVRVLDAGVAWMAPSAGTYPEWYRHGALAWGWTDRGELLGHDLAGEGWGLRLGAFAASGEDEYAAALLLTRRGDENLLAPPARGWGIEVRTEGRKGLPVQLGGGLQAGWSLEAGRLGGHGVLEGSAFVLYRF